MRRISFRKVIHRARWATDNGNGEPVANAQVKSWWYWNRVSPFLPWAVVPIGGASLGGCSQTQTGHRDAAGQQRPANDPPQSVRCFHRKVLSLPIAPYVTVNHLRNPCVHLRLPIPHMVWAQTHGYNVVGTFADLGISAGKTKPFKRPDLASIAIASSVLGSRAAVLAIQPASGRT